MVDSIFNRYICRKGRIDPFLAKYCDGKRVKYPGLWQWSTVALANQGKDAFQVLKYFYPNDIQVVENTRSIPPLVTEPIPVAVEIMDKRTDSTSLQLEYIPKSAVEEMPSLHMYPLVGEMK
jgi:hypothetical protein